MDITTAEIWVLVCTALVFFMQAGFACYEAGLSRSKNSIDVACKNLFDFCVAGFVFWGVGFGFMFGDTVEVFGQKGWVGGDVFTATYESSKPSVRDDGTVGAAAAKSARASTPQRQEQTGGQALFWVRNVILTVINAPNIVGDVIKPTVVTTAVAHTFPFRDREPDHHWPTIFFLFQLVYCSTAITIVSGAVGERMRFWPYVALSIFVAAIIYPVFGHWAWAGLGTNGPDGSPDFTGWLGKKGFRDFAGSTVIHVLGASVALAGVLVIGSRKGKFPGTKPRLNPFRLVLGLFGRAQQRDVGPIRKIRNSHNLPLAALGLFILWFGWLGLTGGRTFAPNTYLPVILLNTLLAGVAGGLGGLLFSVLGQVGPISTFLHLLRRRLGETTQESSTRAPAKFTVSLEHIMNGVIAGLVSVSASCNNITNEWAIVIGFIGALAMHCGGWFLDHVIRADDVVGAIAAHGFAGIWGTMAVAMVPEAFPEATVNMPPVRWDIQLLGVGTCFALAFIPTWLILLLVQLVAKRYPSCRLRPSDEDEEKGMNITEHGATTEFELLTEHLIKSASGKTNEPLQMQEFSEGERKLVHAIHTRDALRQKEFAEDFFRSMSHEIRTPMGIIGGYTEELHERMKELGDEDGTATAERILEQGSYLRQLIDDTLDLSKMEAGRLETKMTRFSLPGLIEETVELMSMQSRAKNLYIEVTQQGLIPETITSDRTRIKQILVNLLSNAIKFTEAPGKVRLVTRLVDVESQHNICFTVVDEGCGIPDNVKPNLFQPFIRGETKEKGTGLGLTISKRLAEMLGGTIGFRSEEGRGTTFEVTLPCGTLEGVQLVAEVAFGSRVREVSANVGRPREVLEGEVHVLLAEDVEDMQRMIRRRLERAGARVDVVGDGQAAIEAVLSAWALGRPFDLVLMDMRMPLLDGYQATEDLRAAGYPGVVVALTAHAMPQDRDKCKAAGCDDFITKPLPKDFVEHLKRLVGLRPAVGERPRELHSTDVENDDAEMTEAMGKFLASLPGYIAEIKVARNSTNWHRLQGIVHNLKGLVSGYGFHHVTPTAAGLLRELRTDKYAARIDELLSEFTDLLQRLRPGEASPVSTRR